MPYTETSKCRISGSANLVEVLDLGHMSLAGTFPRRPSDPVSSGPVSLVYCPDSGLVQMKQSYDLNEMYGSGYGYRSGLNGSMVKHLTEKAKVLSRAYLRPGAVAFDIGGNDGTFLRALPDATQKVLIDPTANKWAEFHDGLKAQIVADFFPPKGPLPAKADLITSIACFYDLEDPNAFVRSIAHHLGENGVWHFEQSYLPSMLAANAYDTVCQEHLEYYNFRVVDKLLRSHHMKVIDVEFNQVNGGSFAVTATHMRSNRKVNHAAIQIALDNESQPLLPQLQAFENRVHSHREELRNLIKFLNDEGKTVAGLGASTKFNVMLQFCGFTREDIHFISDVNQDKWGHVTPGSHIPIVSEAVARKLKPDYFLVGPWHFRDGIIEREQAYLKSGGQLIFPLPSIEIVQA